MRIVIALVLFCSITGPSHAQTPQIDRVNIVEVGIYDLVTVKKLPEASEPTGFRDTVGEIRILESGTIVPGKIGVRFGFRYTIVGTPKDEKVDIRVVNKFPAPGLRNPKTGEITFQSEYIQVQRIGTTSYRGYNIDEDWEVVPGVWSFELWHKDRKLAEQSFTVTKP